MQTDLELSDRYVFFSLSLSLSPSPSSPLSFARFLFFFSDDRPVCYQKPHDWNVSPTRDSLSAEIRTRSGPRATREDVWRLITRDVLLQIQHECHLARRVHRHDTASLWLRFSPFQFTRTIYGQLIFPFFFSGKKNRAIFITYTSYIIIDRTFHRS